MAQVRIPKDYEKKTMRSVHNRSCIRRTTMHPGLGVPIYSRRVMAGEKVFIDPVTVLQTNALQAPLMGSFRLQLAVFFDSDSNYYSWMDNNTRLSTQEYLNRQRFRFKLRDFITEVTEENKFIDYVKADSTIGVQKHSLFEYMGLPVGTVPIQSPDDFIYDPEFDAGFLFTYLNIFRNYYCNNQQDDFPVCSSLRAAGSQDPFLYRSLKDLDKAFRSLRCQEDGVLLSANPADPGLKFFYDYLSNSVLPFGGLWCATYQPDLLTNLLNISNNVRSYVKFGQDGDEANSFSIDTLRFQNKLQRLIDRIDVSGGRFSSWLRAVWGVRTRKDMDIPELIGVTQKLIDPTEIVTKSNSGAIGAVDERFVGDLAGNFNKTDGHRGHSFYASTSGRVMVIVTLIPNVDYVQGVDYELVKTAFADDYTPEFAQLGYQKVPLDRYSVLPQFNGQIMSSTTSPDSDVVGKQVAWLEEMTDVNRNFGEFSWRGLFGYWVLNRLFSKQVNISSSVSVFKPSITQYINPLDYQYPFVVQSIEDPNWFLQVGLRVKAVRPIGKRYMPNLE